MRHLGTRDRCVRVRGTIEAFRWPAIALLAVVLAVGTAACACTGASDPATATAVVQAAPRAPDRSALVVAVDRLAEDALEQGPIAGLSIAVVEHGRQVVAKGYGFADAEAGVPATAETSYPIASITKQFTAALVLRLAEQGQLTLDDPLQRFFPEARAQIGVLTLRQLLDHGSGLTRGGPAPREAAANVLRRGGVALAPGAAFAYSNYNFSLLGLVIEHVTGSGYAAYVQGELAKPLDLAHTGYCEDGSDVPGRVRDYLSTPRRFTRTDYWTKPHFFAAGGLCASVLDLVRFQEQLEAGYVSRASLARMRAPWQLPGGAQAEYGLGTRLGWTAGHRKYGHTGGGQGNKASVARYPAEDLTIAVLLNTERANASVTATQLEERIAQLLFHATDGGAPAPSPATDLERYVGDYREGRGLARVWVGAGALVVGRPGFRKSGDWNLLAGGGDAFAVADEPSYELRFQERAGQVVGLARYRNGWFHGVASRTNEWRPPARSRPSR